jgi:signal transduction histidine kinase
MILMGKKRKLFNTMITAYILFTLTVGVTNSIVAYLDDHVGAGILKKSIVLLPGLSLNSLIEIVIFALSVYLYSRWTSKRITGPLEKITDAIQKMRKGEFTQRLRFKADYELTLIQEHFNEMVAHLEKTEAEKNKAEQSKQRMLLDLSHDLKTPITTIQGYAMALQMGVVDSPEKQRRYLEMIYNKSVIVTALVEDMFQLATLDSPDLPSAEEQEDLAELIRQIAIAHFDQFEQKKFTLDLKIPSHRVMVQMNRNLLYRALSNLLSNTLKHNPEGTEVALSLTDTDEAILLQVMDNGIGIAEELKERIFQPFVRGDEARTGEGTGLGLAIAKKAVELHGGKLLLKSKPGKTVFEVILPKN